MATKTLTPSEERVYSDPHYIAAVERGRKAVKDLQDRGIIDSEGKRIRTDLPPDMREEADRDFGG